VCGSSSLTLRKEHRLRVFENSVLRRMFRSRREEVAGGSRRLCNEELQNLWASPNIIHMIKPRRMRSVRPVARMGDMRPFGRFRRRWEDNIIRDLQE
jgi:hypothetical protein